MASIPITSWQLGGEKVETVADFLELQNHCRWDGDCCHEIKRYSLLGRKADNLDSILESQDITLQTKIHLVKAMVFPVVMYGYESRTIKKAEGQITDAFELMLEKTLESSLDGKDNKPVNPKGNQS